MKKFIITIGRQFGCGAHEIGLKLSEKLGVAYYDKELIKRAAKESGFNEEIFSFYDERPTSSFLYSITTDSISGLTGSGYSLEDRVFQYQFDTIKKVAQEGSCIIVGRCADYIFRDEPNMLKIFLHGDFDYRRRRVIEQYGISEKNAAKEIKNTDKKRAKFHDFHSDYRWGDASTYDLSIDVSKLGIDGAVDLIAHCVNTMFG